MKIIRGYKYHHNNYITSSTYGNHYVINFDSINYILKSNSELGSLELVLKEGPDFTKKALEPILLIVSTLHNNQLK